MKKRLYLHLGEGKCASTSLQEYFRLGASSLLQSGIRYPFAHQGPLRISSGNLPRATHISEVHRRLLEAMDQYPNNNLLFSREQLFELLSSTKNLSKTQKLIHSKGFELHIIWIVRNDLELLPSIVHQRSKSQGPTKGPRVYSIEDIAQLGITLYLRRIRMIHELHELAIPFHIFNLSSTEAIQELVFNAIGVAPPSVLEIPRINRSLSVNEFALITALRHLDNSSKKLADWLTLAAPEKPPIKLGFNSDEKEFLWYKLNPLRLEFNKRIPQEGRIDSISVKDPMKEGSISIKQLNQLYLQEEQMERFKTWHNSIYIRKDEILSYIPKALMRKILRALRLKS